MGEKSRRRDLKNQFPARCLLSTPSRFGSDPRTIHKGPRCLIPHFEAGHTTELDRIACSQSKKIACISRGVHTRPEADEVERPFSNGIKCLTWSC